MNAKTQVVGRGEPECASEGFFDNTVSTYRHLTQRVNDVSERVHSMTLKMTGDSEPPTELPQKDREEPRGAFERCNHAQRDLKQAVSDLEDAVTKLECTGLF